MTHELGGERYQRKQAWIRAVIDSRIEHFSSKRQPGAKIRAFGRDPSVLTGRADGSPTVAVVAEG